MHASTLEAMWLTIFILAILWFWGWLGYAIMRKLHKTKAQQREAAVLGFLLGPIGVLISVLGRDPDPTEIARLRAIQQQRQAGQ